MRPGSAARLGLLAALWGSSFLWIKLALHGLSPVQLTALRLAIGAAVLTAVVHARGLRLPRDRPLRKNRITSAAPSTRNTMFSQVV